MTSQSNFNIDENTSYLSSNDTIQNLKDELSEFLLFRKDETASASADPVKEEAEEEGTPRNNLKRKRKTEDVLQRYNMDNFLSITYPLSVCRSKGISVGLVKSFDYLPHVIINQGMKCLYFTETTWNSFLKHLHLFECYLINNVHGRKTSVRLPDSDMEIDSIKLRGVQLIRLKDVTKYDSKIQLNQEEFFVLNSTSEAVTRYLKQLTFGVPIIKDYLNASKEIHPDTPLPFSPVDISIYNRLPQELHMWRELKKIQPITQHSEIIMVSQPQNEENEDDDEEDVGEVKEV